MTPGSGTGPATQAPTRHPRAFVLLARGFSAEAWHEKWRSGQLLGLNEPYAYGYHHAKDEGFDVVYSQDAPEGPLGKLFRLGIRAITGFDFAHAWHNRAQFSAADVVWTHTESQSLAAGLLYRLTPAAQRPRMILQSVWLMDSWARTGALRRRLYQWLLAPADVLTFHSPLNVALAREAFAGQRCELVHFGIAHGPKVAPKRIDVGQQPLRVLSLGSDRHRDWGTLIDAVRGSPELTLTIVSGTLEAQRVADVANARIVRPKTNDELKALFGAADVVVVPLKPNLHASGITVMQEAAVMGLPMVVADVGGLRDYFGDDCVSYVPSQDVAALRAAILAQRDDPDAAHARATAAQARMGPTGLSAVAFAHQHAALSRQILA